MTATAKSPLSDDQLQQWHDRGYFIVRNVIDRDEAMEIRGVLRNRILTPDVQTRRDEMDPARRFAEQRPCRPLMIARSPLASQPGVGP